MIKSRFRIVYDFRGVATNTGLAGTRFKLGPFLYRKYERGIKKPNVSSSC